MKYRVAFACLAVSIASCAKKERSLYPDEPHSISRRFYVYLTDTVTGKNAFLPGSKYYAIGRDTPRLIQIYDFGTPTVTKFYLDSANNICFTTFIFHEYTYTAPEIAYKNVRFDFRWVIYIKHMITDTLDIVKNDEANIQFYLNHQLIKTGSINDRNHYLELKK